MADAPTLFEWVASALQRRTPLTQLEARGTLRLVLKHAGLDPKTVAAHQMEVVIQRLLPAALSKRRVENAKELCLEVAAEMKAEAKNLSDPREDTAYDVFSRLDSRKARR